MQFTLIYMHVPQIVKGIYVTEFQSIFFFLFSSESFFFQLKEAKEVRKKIIGIHFLSPIDLLSAIICRALHHEFYPIYSNYSRLRHRKEKLS